MRVTRRRETNLAWLVGLGLPGRERFDCVFPYGAEDVVR